MSKMSSTPVASAGRTRLGVAFATAVILVMATVTAACGGSRAPSEARGGKSRLIWGKPAEVIGMDPTVTAGATSWELFNLVYENLVTIDGDFKPVPQLAESIKQPSPTTYVFTLRQGVRFSNGRPMTVDDVVGSLERVIDPKVLSPWRNYLGIRRIAATGSDKVTITLNAPNASFLAALAASYPAVLPMKELKAGSFVPTKQMLGTGPFKVVNHIQDESWTFDRNPYYWRQGVPTVDTLTVRILPDDAARAAALRSGAVDVTTFEIPDSVRLLKNLPNVITQVQRTTDYYRIDVNAVTSIFKDDRLRQALSLAVDRDRIRNVALGGAGIPTAAAPVTFPQTCDPAGMPYAKPDLSRARALVQAAGATGKTVEILTPTLVPASKSIAVVLKQNLDSIGLKASVVPMEITNVIKKAWDGGSPDFDLIVTWFVGYGDPAMLFGFWNPDLGSFTKSYVRADPQLNKLISQSQATPPGERRADLLTRTCSRISENANIVPLVTKDAFIAYRKEKLSALKILPEGYGVPLRYLAESKLSGRR
jgi:peptide/nickel transport system substrate-binding protein